MILFYYDSTWEGLLTAVFDAYARRQFPNAICPPGTVAPLFTETVHEVVTESAKASRVWKALEKKVPHYVCNMFMCVWLSEEEGSDMLLMRYMKKVFDSPPGITLNFGDDDILKVKKLAQKVSHEGHRLAQFVRFQKASDGTFFAPVAPQYNSLPISLHYFRDRFADQKWLIYDTKRHYGFLWDLEKVTEITLTKDDDLIEGKLTDEMMAADEKQFQQMWRTYHKALSIKERVNPRLQRQNMPRRYWKYLTEMQ